MAPDGTKDGFYSRMGEAGALPVDKDPSVLGEMKTQQVEVVQYREEDLQTSPIDVSWEKKWAPLPPLAQIPMEDRKEWMVTRNENILELIDRVADRTPDKVAITWLGEKGKVEATYTFSQVVRKSHGIAQKLLQKWGLKFGDHVILVYPPGPEFIIAFLACLRAGVVAVPVYPPSPLNLKGDMFKLEHIATNSGSKAALTTGLYKNVVRISKLRGIKWPVKDWYPTDGVEAISGQPIVYPARPKDHLAFLQYTSGSTSDPKGVMITHANIAHNSYNIRKNIRLDSDSVFFSWLPQYHDLGLIVAYISTMTAGAGGVFMSPITFIKNPPLWVVGMSQFQATHTACPNFALELVVRKFRPEEHAKNGLDLSRLEAMLNCAEPVRVDSIEKWNATFTPYGFHPAAMCPSYGLAEHTVGMLSWGIKVVAAASGDGLLHASGHWKCQGEEEGDAVFVDPDTLEMREPGQVGEIWVRSESVAAGYWQKPKHTEEAFRAKITNKPEWEHYNWLRTGDLGFRLEDQLFICGRLKDLIIVRGKNYYPQDMELAATLALEDVIRPGCIAAFALSDGPGKLQDQVGLVAEVKSIKLPMPPQRAIAIIRQAVSTKYGLELAQVALVAPRTICKTTSGKIQRGKNRIALLEGKLQIIQGGLFVGGASGGAKVADGEVGELEGGNVEVEKEETEPFKILARFGVKDLDRDVLSQGLDSLRCMELLAYLKKHASIEVEPTLLATVPARQLVDGTYQSTPPRVQRPSLEAPLQGRPLPFWAVCVIQTLGILLMGLLIGAAIIPTYRFVDHVLDVVKTPFSYMTINSGSKVHHRSFRIYGLLLPLAVPLWMATFSLEVLAVKWIVIGRYRPGCHPMNSWYFLRWWFMDRMLYIWEEVVGVYCLNTIVLNLFYIVGGAHVAWSAQLGAFLHEWDLHYVGPHAEVNGRLIARLIAPGRLYLNKVIVGRGAAISDHTVVQPGAIVAAGAKLRPMTVLLEGTTTEEGVTYQGNPARAVTLRKTVGSEPPSRVNSPERPGSLVRTASVRSDTELTGPAREENEDRHWWMLEASKIVFGLPLTIFLFTYTQIPVMALFELINPTHNQPHVTFRYKPLFFFGVLIFASMAVGTFITICLKWVLFGRVQPGPYKNTKWLQWRKWWLDLLTLVCQHNLLDVFESSFFVNFWLSSLGARISASTKLLISYTIRPYEADLLIAEPDTFISESFVSCDDDDGNRDHVVFKRGSWTGLGAVIEQGTVVGEGSGVGAVTYVEGPHEALAGPDVMLFGNPPIVLHHQKAQESMKRLKVSTIKLIFFHTLVLAQRLVILGVLIVVAIPGLEFGMMLHRAGLQQDLQLVLLGIGILLSIATLAMTSILFKWLAHSKFRTGRLKHSLAIATYTTTDTLDNYMVFRFVFPFINGSYLAVLFHRAMGGRIGKNCFMNPGSFRDHDIIAVGDDVILDECHVQGHKFEHGHIAFDVTAIGSGTTLQPEAICMAGDSVEDGATLASLSKPFPGLPCSADRYWVGSPACKAKIILANGEEMEEADSGLGGGYDMEV